MKRPVLRWVKALAMTAFAAMSLALAGCYYVEHVHHDYYDDYDYNHYGYHHNHY
jgi:hypothetical protein